MRNILITPNCCEEVQNNQTVFLRYDPIFIIYNKRLDEPPKWKVEAVIPNFDNAFQSVEVSFCPHCGSKLPEIEEVSSPMPICTVIDGGYHCSNCGDRLIACRCLPPEANWKVKGSPDPVFKDHKDDEEIC